MNSLDNTQVCFSGPFQVTLESAKLNGHLEPDQVRIRTIYTLISPGTELALYSHSHIGFQDPENHWAKYPFYPGYSAVGEVEAAGNAVEAFRPGDIVYYWGRHQQYTNLTVQTTPLLAVPDGLSPQYTPFVRMAQIAHTAVTVSDVLPGDTVAVVGLGLVGNLAAQLFQVHGAKTIGIDLIAQRCDVAAECGIEHTINAERQDPLAAIHDVTGDKGAHAVIEATGNPALIGPALKMARPGGEVILLGSPRGTAEIDVYNRIHRSGITLKGAHEARLPVTAQDVAKPNRTRVAQQMLDNLSAGRLSIEPLVSQIVSPHQINDAYRSLYSDKESVIGILVDWSSL